MNAYFASFMLLLFNAVGLVVPAVAAEETAVASGAEASVSSACSDNCSIESGDQKQNERSAALQSSIDSSHALDPAINKPTWALIDRVEETGDKLEHEEGAP